MYLYYSQVNFGTTNAGNCIYSKFSQEILWSKDANCWNQNFGYCICKKASCLGFVATPYASSLFIMQYEITMSRVLNTWKRCNGKSRYVKFKTWVP
mgnify:CR=1 FL=1